MEATEIQQQIERRNHAAADLTHIPGGGGHLISAEGPPLTIIDGYIIVADLKHFNLLVSIICFRIP